ncbi:hypothetical protein Sru01_11350 [Sphaerisporangium rufum]|uniref:histidine kinase n=1 Tax=Sphaerisporangium rufum TaxID=1381558 RepID=A0A919V007_9ACTN|nr:histidine kinase [Sphaerisporangium rufum]GII76153.1 hypothetical protein Sru01_11350 [Sphaerisporangium rufum]
MDDRRPARLRPLVDGGAAAGVVAAFWTWPAIAAGPWQQTVTGAVLAGVTAGAMPLRWRAPAAATLSAAAGTVLGTLLGICQDPMLAAAWCLYPLAIEQARRTRIVAGVLAGTFTGLAMVTAVPAGAQPGPARQVVVAVAALGVAWLLGTATGRQIATAREAERMRVRLAVARDVHDAVGHALGVVLAQSAVTLSLPGTREEELRDTLSQVEAHARTALEEVQGLVRALRAPDGGPGPGLDALAAAVRATRAAGVEVDVQLDAGGPIGDRTAAAAFRVAQEALANVVRHAPGARCSVRIGREGGLLVLRVEDGGARTPGGPPPPAGSGTGLRGMRERLRPLGGTVEWGPRPAGGFQVTARLPAGDVR